MDLHFTYSVNGKGYHEAKNNFINRALVEELVHVK